MFGITLIPLPKWVLNWGWRACCFLMWFQTPVCNSRWYEFPLVISFISLDEWMPLSNIESQLIVNSLLLSSFCQMLEHGHIFHSLMRHSVSLTPSREVGAQLLVQWGTQEFLRTPAGMMLSYCECWRTLMSNQIHLPLVLRVLVLEDPTTLLLTALPSQGLRKRDWFLQSYL